MVAGGRSSRSSIAPIRFNGAAKSAVSAALHDLAAKRLGVPLWRMWGLDPARAPRSSFTIGIGDSADIARKVARGGRVPDPQGEARVEPR